MTPGRPYSFGRLFRKRIIMAEDYDVEGKVSGWLNVILRCKRRNGKRLESRISV